MLLIKEELKYFELGLRVRLLRGDGSSDGGGDGVGEGGGWCAGGEGGGVGAGSVIGGETGSGCKGLRGIGI